MTLYNGKTHTTTPEGRQVLVATVRNPIATESAVFPADGTGRVTSAMHLYKAKHDPLEESLDARHEAIVAGVESGELELVEREATPEEAEEAVADLLLLAKMVDKRAIDDWDA
jgi:hypothetical protein